MSAWSGLLSKCLRGGNSTSGAAKITREEVDFEWEADAYGGNLPSAGRLGAASRFVFSTRVVFSHYVFVLKMPASTWIGLRVTPVLHTSGGGGVFLFYFGLFTPGLALRVTAPFFFSPPLCEQGPGGEKEAAGRCTVLSFFGGGL